MMWTVQERFYLVLAFIVAGLAAYGALELTSAITEPLNSTPLAIAVVAFVAVLTFMIKAVEALRSQRTRREIEELLGQKNSK
jgi:ABC-type transport system involved in cytochrome c biogenesis permease subunit